eukprot:366050-Chlamydomonas_euryale.AAC.16
MSHRDSSLGLKREDCIQARNTCGIPVLLLQNAPIDEQTDRRTDHASRWRPFVVSVPTRCLRGACAQGDTEGVATRLLAVATSLRSMQATLDRMGEKCDPYVYYARVRLLMSGWRGNPALPQACAPPPRVNRIGGLVCLVAMRCHACLVAMRCHAMPCMFGRHAMPCNAMRCHAMPCDAMRCHAMRCHVLMKPDVGDDVSHVSEQQRQFCCAGAKEARHSAFRRGAFEKT